MNRLPKTLSFIGLVLCGSVILTTCSDYQAPDLKEPAVAIACVVLDGKLSAKDNDRVAELKRAIEASPFYTIPASTNVLASCDVRFSPDGEIGLEYHFRNGNWLQVKRNERIEYMELKVRLNQILNEQPEAILARAEQAAFGARGCGINWYQSETKQAKDDPNITETLFHGDVCNCQARIRHDASGRAVELMLKSAC
jgi:hypothetical protein